ncbi:putative hydrolase of the HAD superfamily [Diaminobutyricimonas aerilata]|uniref:Putative hydrolase of the HAD superfamily n=1 Tax=Diaminobutyricimonas aerilata TaxID=1162967 RepID=A0A2M9CLK3_9MICO|nr:HAD family phosphatase [Diaminobutyricimonas aerilata]PJJ72784.1 putative hydrolase of the HAD superfamily [Diaminobutyricimonas aerilata]
MSLSIPGRVVVFDYGEVISVTPSDADRAEILALAGVDEEPFWAAYWAHRDGLDQGTVTIEQYWRAVAAETGADWSTSRIQQLWSADFRGWISVDPAVIDLIERLHAGGTRIALLSNAGFDYSSPFRYSPMGRFFERMFVSAEMDAIKPDPAIYSEVAAELGIRPDEMVFIDNKLVNVEGARALGVVAHHFEGVEGLRGFLEGLAA